MKKIVVLLLILSSFLSYSQKRNIYIKTKDNKEYITKKYTQHRDYIYFKYNNLPVKISYGNIEKINIKYVKKKHQKLNHNLIFINYSEKYGALMKPLVKGNCTLYSAIDHGYNGLSGISYFVLRKNENIATLICDNHVVSVIKFKKRASKYFEDCDILVEKIQQKKYKRKQVIEAVKFYNENCK